MRYTSALLFTHLSLALAGGVSQTTISGRNTCTVTANGSEEDDTENILSAFDECGHGGTVVFPEGEEYWIATKLNPVVNDVTIDWRGEWIFSDDIPSWHASSYAIPFQNHAAAFILTGTNITLDGHSTGGINGNGDIWYTTEAGETQPGRIMPFVLWNVTDVIVRDFYIVQSPLWSFNVMSGRNVWAENIYVNATSSDQPEGENWVQNTDGFDSMDVSNATLQNFTYIGGDDCIAIKPRSYHILARNITCHSGNGIAIGSLGQYLEDSSVEDVRIQDVVTSAKWPAYIKTWMGVPTLQDDGDYESGGVPRGGGWGVVRDVVFEGFRVEGAGAGVSIYQDNGAVGNETVEGTSKMQISDVTFRDFEGYLDGQDETVSISCSEVEPCFDIFFEDMDLRVEEGSDDTGEASCQWVEEGGIHGVDC
ncbi:hypothetical protein FQN54_009193 [Arachnomyces sp. PD_36]|nr:hypothetical protein FQN54_009193 [Arachnomyces sp. PD_36]